MRHIKYILFLLVCAGAGYLLMQGIMKIVTMSRSGKNDHDFTRHFADEVQTGKGDAPEFRGFSLSIPVNNPPALFDQWYKLFATTVGIHYSSLWTADDLEKTTEAAHKRGMQVILMPPERAFSVKEPFDRPLAQVADEAQKARVDQLCVSWLETDPSPEYWEAQVAEARQAFRGKLILAATPEALISLSCAEVADELAVIGPIDLPKRLPHDPEMGSVGDLRTAWRCRLTEIEEFATHHKRSVLLLNMDVPAVITTRLIAPGEHPKSASANPIAQSVAYEALCLETKGRAISYNPLTRVETSRAVFLNGLMFNWDDTANPDAVNHVEGMLPKVAELWDPKKPAQTQPDPTQAMPGGDDTGEGETTGAGG